MPRLVGDCSTCNQSRDCLATLRIFPNGDARWLCDVCVARTGVIDIIEGALRSMLPVRIGDVYGGALSGSRGLRQVVLGPVLRTYEDDVMRVVLGTPGGRMSEAFWDSHNAGEWGAHYRGHVADMIADGLRTVCNGRGEYFSLLDGRGSPYAEALAATMAVFASECTAIVRRLPEPYVTGRGAEEYAKVIAARVAAMRSRLDGSLTHPPTTRAGVVVRIACGLPLHPEPCSCVLCSLPRGSGWAEQELTERIQWLADQANASLRALGAFTTGCRTEGERTSPLGPGCTSR